MQFDIFTYYMAVDKLGQKDALPFLGIGPKASPALTLFSVKKISESIAKSRNDATLERTEKELEAAQKKKALKERSKAILERNVAMDEAKKAREDQRIEMDNAAKAKRERDVALNDRTQAISERDSVLIDVETAQEEKRVAINNAAKAKKEKADALKEKAQAIFDCHTAIHEADQAKSGLLKETLRAGKAELKRDSALQEKSKAILDRDIAIDEAEKAKVDKRAATSRADSAEQQRDAALTEKSSALANMEQLTIEKNDAIEELDEARAQIESFSDIKIKIEELRNVVTQDQLKLSEVQRLFELLREQSPSTSKLKLIDELGVYRAAYSKLLRNLSPTTLSDKEIFISAKKDNLLKELNVENFSIIDAMIDTENPQEFARIKENFAAHKSDLTDTYKAFDKWMKSTLRRIRKNCKKRIEAFPPICDNESEA